MVVGGPSLSDLIRPIGLNQPNLITHVSVTITLESLVTNLVSIDFDARVLYLRLLMCLMTTIADAKSAGH